jgi:hypothetical protein
MKKRIVICGSMRFVDKMLEWQQKLEQRRYEVYIPTPEDFHKVRDEEGDLERFEEIKRKETKVHFQKIRDYADILLVLNYDKDGKKNYIGGNTFAEIVYAHALNLLHGRNIDIYTLNPLPEYVPYHEELQAWKVKQWEDSLLEHLTH